MSVAKPRADFAAAVARNLRLNGKLGEFPAANQRRAKRRNPRRKFLREDVQKQLDAARRIAVNSLVFTKVAVAR